MPTAILGEMRPSFSEVEHALQGRWPETRLEPSLDRIAALTRLIGDPQQAGPRRASSPRSTASRR